MGTFNVAFRIEGLQGGETREFEGLVDTGSTYSVVPGSSLREMGIEPTDGDEFELADGRVSSGKTLLTRGFLSMGAQRQQR